MVADDFRYVECMGYIVCHMCHLRDLNFLRDYDPMVFHAKNSPNCVIVLKMLVDEWIKNAEINRYQGYDDEFFLCKVCNLRKNVLLLPSMYAHNVM